MISKTFGNKNKPSIVLLHGGGLSWWAWQPVINLLQENYHLIVPILPGHGESYKDIFISIEDTADYIIRFIDIQFQGHVYAICGLSIGSQILCDILGKKQNICDKAIIESALLKPLPGVKTWALPIYKLMYPLISKKWFAKIQAKALSLPDEMIDAYFIDSSKMTLESLINMTISNGTYTINEAISKTNAEVSIAVGSKEIKSMKVSADLLHNKITTSKLYMCRGLKHGELSILDPERFVSILLND